MAVARLEARSGRIPACSRAEHEAALLRIARELFYESGYEGTSIEAIARAAHVSPKTIYGRFANKEGIFVASVRNHARTLLGPLRAPIGSGNDVAGALIEFAIRLLTLAASPEALLIQRLIIAESGRFPDLGVEFYEAGPKRGIATLAAFFSRATASGFMQVEDGQGAAEMFVGALTGAPIRAALIVHTRLSRKAIVRRSSDVVALFLAAYETRLPLRP